MNPTLATVAAALVTALTADHGGGVDLSDADAVQRGRFAAPPAALPYFACVASPAFQSTQGPPLRQYERRLVFDVLAWAAVDGASTEDRVEAAEDLLDRLAGALEDARVDNSTVLYSCRELVVIGAALDEDLDEAPIGYASVILQVTATYARTSGA